MCAFCIVVELHHGGSATTMGPMKVRGQKRRSTLIEQTKHPFKKRETLRSMNTKNTEKYKVIHDNTERLKNSTVPIQHLLNKKE